MHTGDMGRLVVRSALGGAAFGLGIMGVVLARTALAITLAHHWKDAREFLGLSRGMKS